MPTRLKILFLKLLFFYLIVKRLFTWIHKLELLKNDYFQMWRLGLVKTKSHGFFVFLWFCLLVFSFIKEIQKLILLDAFIVIHPLSDVFKKTFSDTHGFISLKKYWKKKAASILRILKIWWKEVFGQTTTLIPSLKKIYNSLKL